MDNKTQVLKGLIAIADKRIAEIKSGRNQHWLRCRCKYFAEVVDLDVIAEPMIAIQM
jgi:aconitate hydratase 2/2-methylisocitrate dehydratase